MISPKETELLNLLIPEIREQVVENMEKYPKEYDIDKITDVRRLLHDSFEWQLTPQGLSYWQEIWLLLLLNPCKYLVQQSENGGEVL